MSKPKSKKAVTNPQWVENQIAQKKIEAELERIFQKDFYSAAHIIYSGDIEVVIDTYKVKIDPKEYPDISKIGEYGVTVTIKDQWMSEYITKKIKDVCEYKTDDDFLTRPVIEYSNGEGFTIIGWVYKIVRK